MEDGRCGYRRLTAPPHDAVRVVNLKWFERIRRREGLKVPHKHPKKGRLGSAKDRVSVCGWSEAFDAKVIRTSGRRSSQFSNPERSLAKAMA